MTGSPNHAPNALDAITVEVVRNNQFIYTARPAGREAHFTLVDREIPPGENFYYVRVIQEDELMAWVSPIWVTFRTTP